MTVRTLAAALLLIIAPVCSPATSGAKTEPALRALPAPRVDELRELDRSLRRADVEDASHQRFEDRVWLRPDVRSLALLDEAREAAGDDLETSRTRLREFLRQATADGETSFLVEVARLDPQERYDLADRAGCGDDPALECLREVWQRMSSDLLAGQLAGIDALSSAEEVGAWIDSLNDDLEKSVKERGRLRRRILGAPAWPAVAAWRKHHTENEYEGPQPLDFPAYQVYRPAVPDGGDADLLRRWAPIFVQESDPEAGYPLEADRLGSLELVATPDSPRPEVVVDTDRPVTYAYRDTLRLRGQDHVQLVYTFWYPEHPALKKPVDPGAGPIEGITLRITLDSEGHPRLYETVYNCGCSHRVFVDRETEEAAAREYGPPEADRPYSVQRALDDRIDWIVPELVDLVPGRRPIFFVRGGHHFPAAIRYETPASIDLSNAESYEVRPYAELERTPFQGDWASVFDEKGLVRGGHRTMEEIMLTPLGLYRAGHPRQRGTQLIHFDQADFDDPTLFETYLRLPSGF